MVESCVAVIDEVDVTQHAPPTVARAGRALPDVGDAVGTSDVAAVAVVEESVLLTLTCDRSGQRSSITALAVNYRYHRNAASKH